MELRNYGHPQARGKFPQLLCDFGLELLSQEPGIPLFDIKIDFPFPEKSSFPSRELNHNLSYLFNCDNYIMILLSYVNGEFTLEELEGS